MKELLVVICAVCLMVMAADLAEGNLVLAMPWLYLEIYTFAEQPSELPSYVCSHGLVDPGPPPVYENTDTLPCYEPKNPYEFACIPIHTATGEMGFPGFRGNHFGIQVSGEPVTFLGAVACQGFIEGPGDGPAAICLLSADSCYTWRNHSGYTCWFNPSSTTGATYFNIVANADAGNYYAMDCEYNWVEHTVIRGGAQWGGAKAIACGCVVGPTGLEASTWSNVKGLYR